MLLCGRLIICGVIVVVLGVIFVVLVLVVGGLLVVVFGWWWVLNVFGVVFIVVDWFGGLMSWIG